MLVLRHGISERPRAGDPVDPATYRQRYDELLRREGVPFWPDAAWRDVVFGAAMVATVALLAIIVGPPDLGPPPDPSILEAYPRPDWYFLWYFAVLAMAPHHLENIIIVAGPLIFGALLLVVPLFNKGERSVRRRPLAALLVVFIWTMIVVFWVAGERADVVARLRRAAAARRRPSAAATRRWWRGRSSSTTRAASSATRCRDRRKARPRPLRRRRDRMSADQITGADHQRRAQHARVRPGPLAGGDGSDRRVPVEPAVNLGHGMSSRA